MPGAFVPASRSSQLLPSMKPMASRSTQDAGRDADPEKLPSGVRNGHDRVAVTHRLAQDVVKQWEHLRQRMSLPVIAQGIAMQRDRGVDRVGPHTGSS